MSDEQTPSPLDAFPKSRWFYLTWILTYVAWPLLCLAFHVGFPPEGFVGFLVNVVGAFAASMVLGALVTLAGCLAVEKMSVSGSLRTALTAPSASFAIFLATVAGT